MLPLADTTILGANPKFAALYRDLSSNKLNADGTSKLDAKALKEHEAFEKVSASKTEIPLDPVTITWGPRSKRARCTSCAREPTATCAVESIGLTKL